MRNLVLIISMLLCFKSDAQLSSGTVGVIFYRAATATYTTLDPSKMGNSITLSSGNLRADIAFQTAWTMVLSVSGKSTGHWYSEVTVISNDGVFGYWFDIGLAKSGINYNNYLGGVAQSVGYVGGGGNGNYYTNAAGVACGATYNVGDVIGVEWNASGNQVSFYKNNALQCTKTLSGTYYLAVGTASYNAQSYTVNFGSSPFVYTPPSGATGWTN